jgi:hypothetical protein
VIWVSTNQLGAPDEQKRILRHVGYDESEMHLAKGLNLKWVSHLKAFNERQAS